MKEGKGRGECAPVRSEQLRKRQYHQLWSTITHFNSVEAMHTLASLFIHAVTYPKREDCPSWLPASIILTPNAY